MFNNDLEVLTTFGENIEKNLPAVTGNRSYPISSCMRQILDIKNHPFSDSFKKLYVEAKIIGLLTLKIARINEEETEKSSMKRVDINKLYEVKDLLINNLNNPYSIEELSWIAGDQPDQITGRIQGIIWNNSIWIFGCPSARRSAEVNPE